MEYYNKITKKNKLIMKYKFLTNSGNNLFTEVTLKLNANTLNLRFSNIFLKKYLWIRNKLLNFFQLRILWSFNIHRKVYIWRAKNIRKNKDYFNKFIDIVFISGCDWNVMKSSKNPPRKTKTKYFIIFHTYDDYIRCLN